MSDSKKRPDPPGEEDLSVMTPESLQESLAALAENVDFMVDRLTGVMPNPTHAPETPAPEKVAGQPAGPEPVGDQHPTATPAADQPPVAEQGSDQHDVSTPAVDQPHTPEPIVDQHPTATPAADQPPVADQVADQLSIPPSITDQPPMAESATDQPPAAEPFADPVASVPAQDPLSFDERDRELDDLARDMVDSLTGDAVTDRPVGRTGARDTSRRLAIIPKAARSLAGLLVSGGMLWKVAAASIVLGAVAGAALSLLAPGDKVELPRVVTENVSPEGRTTALPMSPPEPIGLPAAPERLAEGVSGEEPSSPVETSAIDAAVVAVSPTATPVAEPETPSAKTTAYIDSQSTSEDPTPFEPIVAGATVAPEAALQPDSARQESGNELVKTEKSPEASSAPEPARSAAAGPDAGIDAATPALPAVEESPVPDPTPAPGDSTDIPAGATGPEPMEFIAPQIISRAEPIYPEKLRKRGEGGVVVLRLLVDETGRVVRVVIQEGLPGSELEGRAVDAALRSTYQPGIEDGEPRAAWVTERFVF